MSNKPQNVVEHQHFCAYTLDECEADPARENVRYDACRLADGTSGVWDVRRDVWMPLQAYSTACFMAKCLAQVRRSIETGRKSNANLYLERPNLDFAWIWNSDRPFMIDVPSEECHPIRTLTLDEAISLRDWLTESIDEQMGKDPHQS